MGKDPAAVTLAEMKTRNAHLVVCALRDQWRLPQSVTDGEIRAAFEDTIAWKRIELSLAANELAVAILARAHAVDHVHSASQKGHPGPNQGDGL